MVVPCGSGPARLYRGWVVHSPPELMLCTRAIILKEE